ncbi:hypothetical protein KL86DYS1_31312 [uncultured Dysgonomonas sp.]|uniref:Uncharacterized protein n=1 Tax=uncultured Dysgonomonas sp. TaxID=206096 RepID=A0A212K3A0_9BACT|nr:hypothetical protein KL86DYS1_31312 [uncultured Dysgonomonas sp.]
MYLQIVCLKSCLHCHYSTLERCNRAFYIIFLKIQGLFDTKINSICNINKNNLVKTKCKIDKLLQNNLKPSIQARYCPTLS